jgi:2-phospho-L-lactate guanylyltransferase
VTGWTAIVPIKPWHAAKSRLASDAREALARALSLDTLDVLTTHPEIERVVVVTSGDEVAEAARSRGATVVVEQPANDPLNDAIREGCAWVAAEGGDGPTVVVPADLAYLSTEVLSATLAALETAGKAHLPDLDGTGTTLLAAPSASGIEPHYGIDSSTLHAAAGFTRLDDVDPRARADIDHLDDVVGDWRPGPRVSELIGNSAIG